MVEWTFEQRPTRSFRRKKRWEREKAREKPRETVLVGSVGRSSRLVGQAPGAERQETMLKRGRVQGCRVA